jgi:succinate-semialdehyde dehydrogenase/glutarate-semialdehyde dehydrogenase
MTFYTRPQLKDNNLIHDLAFIQNNWIETSTKFDVHNPATGALIAEVANLDISHAQDAIHAAQTALPACSGLTGKERANILRK